MQPVVLLEGDWKVRYENKYFIFGCDFFFIEILNQLWYGN